ncbi:MAG: RHS repeat-associated core domain-containing protein [Acidimicrobiales bacterium]
MTFTATITHSGATLAVPGLLQITNTSDAAVTVNSITATLEVFDTATDAWSPIEGTATASSVRAIVDGAPAESPDLVGTSIAPGAAEVAGLSSTFALSPEQLARLDDPAITDVRINVSVINDGDPSATTQVLRLDDGLAEGIRELGADATEIDATLVSLRSQATELQEPVLTPGESINAELTVSAPAATPIQPGESNRAFLNRLGSLDGASVAAALTGSASGPAGPISIVGSFGSTNVRLPIVAADLTTPASAWQGDSFQISVEVENQGSEPATPTIAVSETELGQLDLASLPGTLAPGERAEVTLTIDVPDDRTTSFNFSLETSWAAGADTVALAPIVGLVQVLEPAAIEVIEYTDVPPDLPAGEIRFLIDVRNSGDDPVTGVVVVDTPSPFPLVEGTLETSRGTATADENGITVDVGDLAGGDAVLITYRLDYGSTAPSVGSVTAQATVSSNELADVLSDDPTVDGVADPTVFTFRGAGGDNGGDPSVIGWYADPTYQGGVIAPGDGTVITEPTTFTLAPDAMTIPDGRTVERWRFIATNDNGAEVELGAGEGFPPATLGEFDPSLVSNGAWRLTLEMVDDIDALGIAWTDVIVDGQLKLGRFSMTYRDLQVALGGLPLTVERTYDTLDRGVVGDFGHGWDLSIADFDVSTNGPLGFAGWQQYSCGGGGLIFAELCFTTSRPHYVTVTWPNGEVETFDFTPEGTSTFFAGQAIAAYSARGERTTSTLSPAPGDTSAFYNGETGVILAGGFGEGGTYDPQRFVLTDRFGTTYLLDVDDGLVEAIDRNGNTITVTDDGVISSLGPSIDFTRDAAGRISAITGPDGAEVTYAYDGAGDLVSVVGANDAAFAYTYGTGEAAHYLLEIDDPGTGPNRVLTYDDEGRLTSVTDAEGNTTSIDVDIDARTEIVTSPDGRLTTISSFDERGNALSVNEVYDGANHTSTFTYNASDLPTSRTDALGNTWTGAYDADENLTTYVDPEGNTSAFTYDSYGFPTSVTDAAGNTTGFSYDAAGNMTSITDARNGVQSFTYDGRGNQTSRTDQTGGIWSWAYDTASRVTAATDPLGNTTSYGYDAAGRMTSLVEADGAAWSYSYDVEGNLTSTVDPLGRSTSSVYDARNRLESSTDPAGNTTRYSYDDNDRLVSTTDPTARQWTYTYVFDRLDAATAPDGGVTAYTYDGAGRTLGVIDPLGRTTTYGYDAAGRRTSVTRPAGVGGSATSTWSLDGNGRMVASVNAEGETTSYGLDELGRTVTVTDALGRVSTSTFDAAGNLTASTNPAGESTSYVFDLAGRMTASTDPAGGVTAYGYDAAGNMTSLTDPVDRTWAYGFDELNRQESVTLPSGDASSTTFDAAGQVTTQTSAAGVVTTFDYDPRGLLTSVTDALGNTTAYGYDGAGRRTSMTDGRGNTTTYAFDANGRLLSETDPLGGDVVFGYDLAGQRTSVTDPNGATRTVGFDDAGRMVAAVDAEGRTTTYGYDLVGRRTSMTDGRGITVNSVFDAAGQLTSRVSPNETQSFVYDPAGRRTQMTDASGTTTYAYDPAGRVTEIASPAGTVSYAWNAAGDQTLMGTADALVATSYDTNGFVAETADWAGDTIAYVNDPDGRVTSTTYANGVTTTNSFDAAGRLDRIDHNLAVGSLFFDYTLDANGNRVAVDTVDGTESYTLDALNRLTNATYADGTSEVFGYDAAGNRTSHTDRDGDTVTYNLDQTGALVSDSDGVVYTTDNAGNLVSSSVGAAYVWDDHGRLVEATIDGVTDTAGWNANGDRVELNDATLTLDESGLTTVTDNETDTFLHGEDGFSREGDTWVLTDAVGSVRATVNAAGELVDTIDYTAFGQPLNASSTTFGFAGEYTDPTGLLHLRARPYDPGTGRFLAMDPVQPGSPGTTGWQHYAYAGNNPSTWTDPTGMLVAERSTEHKIVVITAPAVAGTGLAVSKAINIAVGLALINRVDCVILHLVCNSTDEDGPQEEGADSPDVIDLTQHTAEQIANAYGTDANLVRDCMASGDPDSPACQSLPEGAREAATGAADSVGPSLGSDWVQRSASEIPGSTGCDECADRIIDLLGGGEKIRIEPRATPLLGEYRGQMTGWSHHTVVLHQGLVFDAFGPSGGTPVDEWLQLWDSPGTDFRMLE